MDIQRARAGLTPALIVILAVACSAGCQRGQPPRTPAPPPPPDYDPKAVQQLATMVHWPYDRMLTQLKVNAATDHLSPAMETWQRCRVFLMSAQPAPGQAAFSCDWMQPR